MEIIGEFLNRVSNYAKMIEIWDVIDVGIIAFLIYKVLIFLRRTNSANVLKGIVLLIVALWLSSIMNLTVINWLLGRTLEIGILALVVLFQPELRRALEKVGTSSLMKIFSESRENTTEEAITQTVIACTQLSQSKTGALIVFERDIRLDDISKTGTAIDARPTAELIKNIFFPKTPLHDGAILIREGKITSAACMLPNSTNTNISRELGTRHRAAVGVSEASDAVAVVVSEETGAISVAVDGMLKRHLTADTLEKLLRNELISEDVEGKQGFFSRLKVKRNGE